MTLPTGDHGDTPDVGADGPDAADVTPEEVAEVQRWLASAPVPQMPTAVAERLDQVLVTEVERRDQLLVAPPPGLPRTTLGSFGLDLYAKPIRRYLVPALAAVAAAFAVGFGAYVVSASAGLNEPPVVAAVSSGSLGAQASALERNEDLTPHRFSRAWQCARQATSGRIIGLASTTVNGEPALLVYTRSGSATLVTLVTGCGTGRPTARESANVGR